MKKPLFNKLLVEIREDPMDRYGSKGEDGSMLGASYREGTLLEVGWLIATADYPNSDDAIDNVQHRLQNLIGKPVMWHEGTEAGTIFEEGGKQYAFIYWWDLVAAE